MKQRYYLEECRNYAKGLSEAIKIMSNILNNKKK